MEEAVVEMVGTSMTNNYPIVILKTKESRAMLLLGIGVTEAYAIHLGMENRNIPRPLTHDLMNNILLQYDIDIVQVKITELRDDVFYGEIELKMNGHTKVVDSRPSDAVALALRKGAPIYIGNGIPERQFVYGDPREYINPLKFKEKF